MANNPNATDNLKPFKPGDPRINRNGRPRSFDTLRKLMQTKAGEIAVDGDGKPIERDGKPVTNAEMFVEAWMKDKKQRRSFAEFAWGKPVEEVEVKNTGDLKVVIEYADNQNPVTPPAPGADTDQE
jgi:hypothetical protein